MTRRFEFDSEVMGPEEGFEAYRRLYASGSDVTRTGGPFRARVRALNLDSLILYERELTGVMHSRVGRVETDAFQHFALHLVVAGELRGSPESRFERAGPGELVLVDTRKPSRTEAVDLHLLTASVPRSAVASVFGSTARLHGEVVRGPGTRVLAEMMRAAIRHGGDLPTGARPSLRRALIELLAGALEADTGFGVPTRSDLDERERAIAFILANLGDRRLNAETVAEAIGSSRSSVYRLFTHMGGVAQFIMARRLSAVREALEAGSAEPLAELAAAWGFTDESHLNRRFTRAYGQPAGAFRRVVASDTNPVKTGARRLKGWVSDLD